MSRCNKNRPAGTQVNTEAVAVNDAFSNPLFRLGWGSQSPLEATEYPLTRMTDNYALLNSLSRTEWVVQNVVDLMVDDMLREWYKLTGAFSPEMQAKIDGVEREVNIRGSLKRGLSLGRLYGGAVGIILIQGQEDLSKPIDLGLIFPDTFKGLMVLDRWHGVSPNLGLVFERGEEVPESYSIVDGMGHVVTEVHHSRVIRFIGRELPPIEREAEMYWGESEVEPIYKEIVSLNNVSANMAALTFQANINTMEVKGLEQLFSIGSSQAQRRFWNVMQAQSVLRSNFGTQLVEEGNKITNTQYNFAGLQDVYESMCMNLCGGSHYPMTKLFGRSPSGLNATGESDLKNYYDYVDSQREAKLRPALQKLLPVLAMSAWGFVPDDLDFTFPPLWTPTAKEVAEIAKTKSEAIVAGFQAGLYDKGAAMKELKKLEDETGMFGSISDEAIAASAGQTYQDVTALRDPLMGLGFEGQVTDSYPVHDYSPNQPRDRYGRWTSVGASGGSNQSEAHGGGQGADKPVKVEQPELKQTYKDRLEEGRRLREEYPDYEFGRALERAWNENPDLIQGTIEDVTEWGPNTQFTREQFVKAGFYGDKPEYVSAVRYGELPENGRSMNFAEGSLEQGVSVVRIARHESDYTAPSFYDQTLGWQDIPKYEVQGWFLGRTGADGEPLLIQPKIIRRLD